MKVMDDIEKRIKRCLHEIDKWKYNGKPASVTDGMLEYCLNKGFIIKKRNAPITVSGGWGPPKHIEQISYVLTEEGREFMNS